MKLSLLTYSLARTWSLDKIVDLARAFGFAGLEFRAEANHAHGVELERTTSERREIRDRIADAYLEVACIGTGSRFESPEASQRREVIERTKRYVELARDLDCGRIRVFGNNFPREVPRDVCVQYVGESLRALGEFSESYGVDVLLELHGDFRFWAYALGAVEIADHPRVALVYNCETADIVGGSVAATYRRVRQQIRHVHLHQFNGPRWGTYPYPELFRLLAADGYEGYLSSEIEIEKPTPENYLEVYAHLVRAWVGLPFFASGGTPEEAR
jgi:sugar phosphate isomerase/epimerase